MSGLTHQHSPRWPLVDMLHWGGGGEKKNTQTQTGWKTVEEGREGRRMHSGKRGGWCANETWRTRCVCVCVRVYLVCACALVCFAAGQGAYWTGARALVWVGTRLAQWQPVLGSCPPLTIQSQQHSHGGACQGTSNAPHPTLKPTPPRHSSPQK